MDQLIFLKRKNARAGYHSTCTRGIMDDLASVFVTILTAVSVERPYLMVQDPIFGVHHARIYQRQFLGVKKIL